MTDARQAHDRCSTGAVLSWQVVSLPFAMRSSSSEFAAPWPAFLEVSTPGPSPNPSLNLSLNLSLSLSSIQFILFNCLNPDLNLNFLNLDLNLNLYGGVLLVLMLCYAWSNTNSATAHGEA